MALPVGLTSNVPRGWVFALRPIGCHYGKGDESKRSRQAEVLMTLLSLDLQFVDSFRLAVAPFPVMNGAVQDMNWRSYIALRVSKKARIQRLYLGTVKR